MSFDRSWRRLADAMRDMRGYRLLDNDEVLRPGDETARVSVIDDDGWQSMEPADWADVFGKTVAWAQSDEGGDFDASERLFRRKDDR